jgi:hypothetical protein
MPKKDMVKFQEKTVDLAELIKISKNIENTSNFIQSIDEDDLKLYKNMIELLKIDTKNELTQTEYEGIAKMQFFCDRFESLFSSQAIETLDPELLDLYRKMKTQITIFLRDYREGTKQTSPSIVLIKNYLIKAKDELKDLKYVEKEEAEIIDVEMENGDVVQTRETKKD